MTMQRVSCSTVALLWMGLTSLPAGLSAQPNLKWFVSHDGAGAGAASDYLNDVAVDSAGNTYAVGESVSSTGRVEGLIIKYDDDGNQLWLRRYNNGEPGAYDELEIITIRPDGVYIAGHKGVIGPNFPGPDLLLLKYDPDGNLLWERSYDGPGADEDTVTGMAFDSAGNVFVTGSSAGGATLWDIALLKYSPDGTRQWVQRYDGVQHGNDRAVGVAVDPLGNAVVVGTVPQGTAFGSDDIATLKYSPTGALLWERLDDGEDHMSDSPRAVAVDAAGDIYLTGIKNSALFAADWWTVKLAGLDGALLWEHFNQANGTEEAQDLILSPGGDVLTYAYTFTFGPPALATLTTLKLSATDGAQLFEHRRPRADRPLSLRHLMAADEAGNTYLIGTVTTADRAVDFLVVGISPVGRTLFDVTFGELGLANDNPTCLALGPAGLPVVGGHVHHPGTEFNWDFGVIKLGPGIFADGFESGDLAAWSAVQP